MYGITKEDIIEIDELIEKQKKFIEENSLNPIGANIAPKKYLAELNNRVNSLTKLAFEQNLKPIFITITLPSEYHPSSKTYNGSSFKECNKKLYKIWHNLIKSSFLRQTKYHYIQTKEPHKSGVPHLHAVFFLEENSLNRFKKIFTNEMDRNNIKRYEFKTEFKSDKYNRKISAVVAYILKYIFKTFRNSKTGDMSLVSYWYVKHRIRRLTMSRSLIPLRIFRKISYKKEFQDMYKSTKDWLNGRIQEGFKRFSISYLSTDDCNNLLEDSLWTKPIFPLPDTIKLRYKKSISFKIPIFIDGVKRFYNIYSKSILKPLVCPAYLKDYQLLSYYNSLDPDDPNISLLHFGITQNECIRRGLVSMPLHNLNDYNLEI